MNKYTFESIKQLIIKKWENKIISEENKRFFLKLLDKCPEEANGIANLMTRAKLRGLSYNPTFDYIPDQKINYLQKNTNLSFSFDKTINHKLIIGDNYHALNNLLISYKAKINIIYIDPPYGQNKMDGENIGLTYKNNYSLDDWLSMLYPRLEIAYDLLADNGIFLCSIDDKNLAYLKLLLDDIFGEKNFVGQFCWVKKHGCGGNTLGIEKIVSNVEYILCYAKNINFDLFQGIKYNDEQMQKKFTKKDKYFNERGAYLLTPLHRPSSAGAFQYQQSLDYLIKAPDGTYFKLYCNKNGQKKACYTWGYDTYVAGEKAGFIEILKNSNGEWVAYRKQYQFAKFNPKTKEIEYKLPTKPIENYINVESFYIDKKGDYSAQGSKPNGDILNNKNCFAFPKPVGLIKHLLRIYKLKNPLILDFFAGSGTTGQAVLELNAEDGQQRRFILCQNNENGIGIKCCYERLRRIMTGIATNKEKFPWISNKNNKPFKNTLNVYEIKICKDNDLDVFTKIDPSCYFDDVNLLPKEGQEKRDWICENFEVTCKKLKENNYD